MVHWPGGDRAGIWSGIGFVEGRIMACFRLESKVSLLQLG